MSLLLNGICGIRFRNGLEVTRLSPSNNAIMVNSTNTISLFSGLIHCADYGSAMTFNKKVHPSGDHYIYHCSRYANNGKEQHSTHTVKLEMLERVALADMQHYAQAAVKDENMLINKIMSASGCEREREQSAKHQATAKLQKRIVPIDRMVKQLFEEKVNGSVPLATLWVVWIAKSLLGFTSLP